MNQQNSREEKGKVAAERDQQRQCRRDLEALISGHQRQVQPKMKRPRQHGHQEAVLERLFRSEACQGPGHVLCEGTVAGIIRVRMEMYPFVEVEYAAQHGAGGVNKQQQPLLPG